MKLFFGQVNPTVLTMAALRVVSSLIELTAAVVMLLTNDVRKAVAVNSVLAMVGPLIFIITMTIGIYQIAELTFLRKADFDLYGSGFDHRGDL